LIGKTRKGAAAGQRFEKQAACQLTSQIVSTESLAADEIDRSDGFLFAIARMLPLLRASCVNDLSKVYRSLIRMPPNRATQAQRLPRFWASVPIRFAEASLMLPWRWEKPVAQLVAQQTLSIVAVQ